MNSTRLFFRGLRAWMYVASVCVVATAQASAQSLAAEVPGSETPGITAAVAVTPAKATPVPSASPVERGRVLYPANSVQPLPASVRGSSEAGGLSGLTTSFLMLLALCAGGYYLLRRQTGFAPVGKGQRRLVVSESRSLGNRQFLVVVEYENERIMLGVTPGKIDYLCPLPAVATPANVGPEGRPV